MFCKGDRGAGQPGQTASAQKWWTLTAVWEDQDPAINPGKGGFPLQAEAGGHPPAQAGDQEAAVQEEPHGQDHAQHRGAEVRRDDQDGG